MSRLRPVDPIKVMLSSKCDVPFPPNGEHSLSEVRIWLKETIELLQPFGYSLFDVWINEFEGPMPGDQNSLEVCLEAVDNSDILIVLYTGDAGSAESPDNLGICHKELIRGMDTAPAKVSLIKLDGRWEEPNVEQQARNQRFYDYVKRKNLFRRRAGNYQELEEMVLHVLAQSLRKLASLGGREASRGSRHIGPALDWSRIGYTRRTTLMVDALHSSLVGQNEIVEADENLWLKIDDSRILLVPHSIPDSVSVADAREIVGRPFLGDWQFAKTLSEPLAGPLHVISCHKNATELQAKTMLGFPDAMVVSGPFGVFVADEVQKIQFCFITDCIDSNSTSIGVESLIEWLWDSGEYEMVSKRAISRARIVRTIFEELDQ